MLHEVIYRAYTGLSGPIKVGTPFVLTVYTRDMRQPPSGLIRGVFSACCNVAFDGALISPAHVLNPVQFGPAYPNQQRAAAYAGGISRLGAFASFNGLGSLYVVLARIQMVAVKVGTTNVGINFDNLIYPMDDTLVYGNYAAIPPEIDSYVPPESIDTIPTTVQVIA
jgi:hypothetical protein